MEKIDNGARRGLLKAGAVAAAALGRTACVLFFSIGVAGATEIGSVQIVNVPNSGCNAKLGSLYSFPAGTDFDAPYFSSFTTSNGTGDYILSQILPVVAYTYFKPNSTVPGYLLGSGTLIWDFNPRANGYCVEFQPAGAHVCGTYSGTINPSNGHSYAVTLDCGWTLDGYTYPTGD